MNTHDMNGLNELKERAVQMQKDLKKTLSFQMDKLSDILKQVEFKQEKKTKVNKKPAIVMLANDNSIKIIFDNPEDGIKFFEGIK